MKHSEQIGNLAAALASAQARMSSAPFDRENPHFRSKYATLASVMAAIKPIHDEGLALIQSASVNRGEGGVVVEIVTTLAHKSGEWVTESIAMKPGADTPQAVGSAVTYGRRYLAAALCGIASDDDDDGNEASAKAPQRAPQKIPPKTDGKPSPAPSNQKPPEQTKPITPPAQPKSDPATQNQTTTQAPKTEPQKQEPPKQGSKQEKAPLMHYVCSGCAAITSSFEPVEKCRHCTIADTTLTTFRAMELAKDHAKMINSQKAKANQAPANPPTTQQTPAPQAPATTPAPSAADEGKKIVEEVEKIKRFVIDLTGAKNRADLSRELSAMCKREIKGAADLCDAAERAALIARLEDVMSLPPETRPVALTEWKGA